MDFEGNTSPISNDNIGGLDGFHRQGSGISLDKRKVVGIILGVFLASLIVFGVLVFIENRKPGTFISPLGTGGKFGFATTVQNPLTGEVVSGKDAEEWVNVRPLAVMINNYIDARPQVGLIDADLVYEIVAEGGITRFLAFFLSEAPEKIGPIRSTREYYLVLVKELGDAMLMHIGWSPQALVAIETWPVRSLGRGGATFWRDNPRNVATEHTAYANGVELREKGNELGWHGKREFEVWEFKGDMEGYEDYPVAGIIDIDFWYKGDYSAQWKYVPDANFYLRFTGFWTDDGTSQQHVDEITGEQIAVKNVIIQFSEESSIDGDAKNRLEYELLGSGTALIFLDNRVIEATWSKSGRDERTMFYDMNGKEIKFNRGNFWISIVPERNMDQVIYQ